MALKLPRELSYSASKANICGWARQPRRGNPEQEGVSAQGGLFQVSRSCSSALGTTAPELARGKGCVGSRGWNWERSTASPGAVTADKYLLHPQAVLHGSCSSSGAPHGLGGA